MCWPVGRACGYTGQPQEEQTIDLNSSSVIYVKIYLSKNIISISLLFSCESYFNLLNFSKTQKVKRKRREVR